ncbi:hypothetical protein Hanom_Chr07g00580041 [Helianthus anomalus]
MPEPLLTWLVETLAPADNLFLFFISNKHTIIYRWNLEILHYLYTQGDYICKTRERFDWIQSF